METKPQFRFSVIHPTARTAPPYPSFPTGWRVSYECWLKRCLVPDDVQYILVVHESRWDAFRQLWPGIVEKDGVSYSPFPEFGQFVIVKNSAKLETYVNQVNAGARHATGQIICLNMDDLFPPLDWDKRLTEEFSTPRDSAVLHVSTQRPRDRIDFTPQILTRARYEKQGYVFFPEFESMLADTDFAQQAQADGCVIEAPHILFEHRHFDTGLSQTDEIYEKENRPEAYALGETLFATRQRERIAKGKPWPPKVLGICAPGETFSAAYLAHMFELWNHALGAGYGVTLFQAFCTYVHITRQNLLKDVLAYPTRVDYALWVDDDNLVEWAHLERLLQILESRPDVDMAAGWYWVKGPGGKICTVIGDWNDDLQNFSLRLLPPQSSEPFFADAIGFGCVLMRREVLERVGMKGFVARPDNWDPEKASFGEDFAFCLAAKRLGMKLMVDPKVFVAHMKLQALAPPVLDSVAVAV